VTFTAYIRRIYVLTFRMVSGFEWVCPLAQRRPPISAGCSSDRSFAYSFLQIPPHDGHPCCSASSSHHQGLQGTFTPKSTMWPPQPPRLRLRATRHAWRTNSSGRPTGRPLQRVRFSKTRLAWATQPYQKGKTKTADFLRCSTAADWLGGHECRAYGRPHGAPHGTPGQARGRRGAGGIVM
jgi:hypothetical protein